MHFKIPPNTGLLSMRFCGKFQVVFEVWSAFLRYLNYHVRDECLKSNEGRGDLVFFVQTAQKCVPVSNKQGERNFPYFIMRLQFNIFWDALKSGT